MKKNKLNNLQDVKSIMLWLKQYLEFGKSVCAISYKAKNEDKKTFYTMLNTTLQLLKYEIDRKDVLKAYEVVHKAMRELVVITENNIYSLLLPLGSDYEDWAVVKFLLEKLNEVNNG